MTTPDVLLYVQGVTGAGSVMFMFAYIVGQTYAKGTRGRYRATTVAWAFVPLALVDDPLYIVAHVLYPDVFDRSPVGGLLSFAVTCWFVYLLHNSDDDNYWRGRRKRLKSWLRARVRILRPAPALGY